MNKIPQSELEVMKIIWENQEPVSSKIVTTKLTELKGWARTTTLTLLSRLVEKKFLNADVTKRCTQYTSNVKKEDYLLYATKNFLNDVFNKDINELEKMIIKIKETEK